MLSQTEKRLAAAAIVFVVIYLGAAALTLYHRSGPEEDVPPRIESAAPHKAEGRLALVELFPPMMVLLTLTIAFLVAKKKRTRQLMALEASDDEDFTGNAFDAEPERDTSSQGK
jgi:hypothetical protein